MDYQRVLDTQRDLTIQQDNLVFTAGSVGLNLVSMYRAWAAAGKSVGRMILFRQASKRRWRPGANWGDMLSPKETEYPPSQEVKQVFHRPDW